ncbi:MAG: hypothetical protein ACKO5E_11695 [bacterium]
MPEELIYHRLSHTAIGLSLAAVRASLMPRVWLLLALGIAIDRPVMKSLDINRHVTAKAWTQQSWDILPEFMHDFAEKAWLGPLGLVAPLFKLMEASSSIEFLMAVIGICFTILLWGLIGGSICRIAVARMANRPIPGVTSSINFAWNHKNAIWGPILTIVLTNTILFLAILFLGFLQTTPFAGQFLGWFFVPVSIILSIFIAISTVGLALGWPMILGAAMTEADDSFDSLSRSQSYLFQAPVSWLSTFKIGVIVQAITWLIVNKMTWLVSCILLSGNSLFKSKLQPFSTTLPDPWNLPVVSSDPALSWLSFIASLASCWPIAFEFAFAGAIYLTLRLRLDGISPKVIFTPGQAEGGFYEDRPEF